MKSIDERISTVSNPDVRPLVAEAWKSYGVGAFRATVVLTWLAVCADLSEKISRLADDGDGEAKKFQNKILAAEADGLSPSGISAMQQVEREVLSVASKVELIDAVAERELARIREDRHLCAHPSLRGTAESYVPSAELARAHLSCALDNVLNVPATQGKRVVDRYLQHVLDPLFVVSSAHLIQTFYERVQPAARRRIIDVTAKHALLAPVITDPPGTDVIAARLAGCLHIFADRDRHLVAASIGKHIDQLAHLHTQQLTATIRRLGSLDVFWDQVDDALLGRLAAQVKSISSIDRFGHISEENAAVIALCAVDSVSERLPSLLDRFKELQPGGKGQVMGIRAAPLFVPYVAELVREAQSFRGAEALATTVILPHAPLFALGNLKDVLGCWSSNAQCQFASGMPGLAEDLVRATTHLWPASEVVWRGFVDAVGASSDGEGAYDAYYRYSDIERLLWPA
jgi:hypothetical protein